MEIDLLTRLTSLLAKIKIPYMISGGVAVIYYGLPRLTHDFDLVIHLRLKDLSIFLEALESLKNEFIIDRDQIKEAVSLKSQFNLYHPPSGLKVDFWLLKNEAFDKERFGRRKKEKIHGKEIYFSSAEDLILIKLKWYKNSGGERHLFDAASVFQVQKEKLDFSYLEKWAKRQKTQKFLGKLGEIEIQKT